MKRIIATILALCILIPTAAFASETKTSSELVVRVNGHAVEFPDGQPYFDENSRTMIPVRFVTEELGADVSWNGKKQAAVIEKDAIRIEIPIGHATFTVTEKGTTRNVTMDTTAVAMDGRTYVPIRFVAEALGAYVDYSSAYKTVGIYQDELTAEEIATLRGYAYTQPKHAIGYETSKAKNDQKYMDFYYGGSIREQFHEYSTAHEFLYSARKLGGTYVFDDICQEVKGFSNEFILDMIADEAKAEVAYSSENMTVEFRTDTSCIYQPDTMNSLFVTVRGIATATLHVKPTKLPGAETKMLCDLGYTQLFMGENAPVYVDVHMRTSSSSPINIYNIAPLC